MRQDAARQHPDAFGEWAEALLDRPSDALADIVSGRGARGPLQLAEPDDFLADLLAQPSLSDRRGALVEAIDEAIIQWMDDRVDWLPEQISAFGTRAYAAQFSDVLAAVARLPLSAAPTYLMANVPWWDDRLRSMRWPNDIDLLRRFDLALAQHQVDARCASRWFGKCDEAAWAGPYWRSGLSIGLIGLRKMPGNASEQPERRVATALARFAALSSERGTGSTELRFGFVRHAKALTALYPRHDQHWTNIWADALETLQRFPRHRNVVRDWLPPGLQEESPARVTGRQYIARPKPRRGSLPPKYRLDRVIGRLADGPDSLDEALWVRIRDLLHAHWGYAISSGESYYAVRTTHNLCDQLLRRELLPAHLKRIHGWTLQAIQAEPGNAYLWDMWAKVLAALGAEEASIDVRWEAVRRFPDNIVVRMALVVALADRRRAVLAERLYRETLRDFPNDAYRPHALSRRSPFLQRGWEQTRAKLLETMSADEPFDVSVAPRSKTSVQELNLEPQLQSFLESLGNHRTLLERYFSVGTDGRDAAIDADGPEANGIASEIELVVACRVCRSNRQHINSLVDAWAQARPASYSARLLLVAQGSRELDLHQLGDDLSRIQAEFPEHRKWNQWLSFGLAVPERRSELRRTARKEHYWDGRLSAIYPGLAVPYRRKVDFERELLWRLFEDVALANADVGLPQVRTV